MSVNAISFVAPPVAVPQAAPIASPGAGESGVFGEILGSAVAHVESLQRAAHASANSFMNGETEEIHKVALDQQQAAIAFDLLLQVRNKVVSAYQEVMKMQV